MELDVGSPFYRNCCPVLRCERIVCPLLRETLGENMETIIAAIIAVILFAYLLVAMLHPEKF